MIHVRPKGPTPVYGPGLDQTPPTEGAGESRRFASDRAVLHCLVQKKLSTVGNRSVALMQFHK
jgi:hypothetical protein